MSFIAGYQAKAGRPRRTDLAAKLRSFRIVSGEDLNAYACREIATPHGSLLWRYKTDYPIQTAPQCDDKGNAQLLLGFSSPLTAKNDIEGEFVAVHSDSEGNVSIVNDRFGSRPFYVLDDADGIYFSSNLFFILHLVGNRVEPDLPGWFQVFGCGHTFGNRTTFKGVRRLPPATQLTIAADGTVHEKSYWRLEHKPDDALDLESHSRETFAAFRSGAALRAGLTGKGVIALSGGLDSRLVAGALPNRAHFPAFTFINSGEDSSTPETRIASEVSRILGLEHHIEPIPKQELYSVAADVVRLTAGMRPLHHSATVMPYVRELKRRELNFLLGGGPGDVSAGSKIPSARYLDTAQTRACIADFCRGLTAGYEYLELFFRPEIVRSHRLELDRTLVDSFATVTGPTAAHRVTAWEMLHRWPAFTFTSVLHNHPDISEGFCHLDYRYSDLMLKLPADWLFQRNFYSCMIYRSLPELRAVPYANTGKLLSGQLQQFEAEAASRRLLSTSASVARKLVPKSIKRRLRAKDTPSFSYDLYKKDVRLLAEIRECLHALPALRTILDTDRCMKFIDGFVADNLMDVSYSGQTELMGSLASLCHTFKLLAE